MRCAVGQLRAVALPFLAPSASLNSVSSLRVPFRRAYSQRGAYWTDGPAKKGGRAAQAQCAWGLASSFVALPSSFAAHRWTPLVRHLDTPASRPHQASR